MYLISSFVLCCLVGLDLGAQICDQNTFSIRDKVDPPNYDYSEFSVDIEMVALDFKSVTQVRTVYSRFHNTIKLSLLQKGEPHDIYLIDRGLEQDGEVIRIYYDAGKGSCGVSSFADEESWTVYFAGGANTGKRGISPPLKFLRLIGDSGFGSEIVLNKADPKMIRGMNATKAYQSCQKWTLGEGTSMNLLVTHYFGESKKPWTYPQEAGDSLVPLQIMVEGSGTYNGKNVENWKHVYNFFRFTTTTNARELELPAGVYCRDRKNWDEFPKVPPQIQFRAEQSYGKKGYAYFEEIFDTVNQFAQLKQDGRTLFREYTSGLSFDIDDRTGHCSVMNITNDRTLPFDYKTAGGTMVHQLSPEAFWYDSGDEPWQYMGRREVRGIQTESWVKKTKLVINTKEEVIVEWYFAFHDPKDHRHLKSWNDNVPQYLPEYRIPVLFRLWVGKNPVSQDIYFYDVDFARFQYGAINIRSCFRDAAYSHLQIICPGAKEEVFEKNLEQFKWKTVKTIAKAANVQWWRIADFQVFFNDKDIVIDFEILDVPKLATDIPNPPTYDSMSEARVKFIVQVREKTFQIQVWNEKEKKMNKPVETVLGTIHQDVS